MSTSCGFHGVVAHAALLFARFFCVVFLIGVFLGRHRVLDVAASYLAWFCRLRSICFFLYPLDSGAYIYLRDSRFLLAREFAMAPLAFSLEYLFLGFS